MSDKQNPVVVAILLVMTLIAGSVAVVTAAEPALILRMGVDHARKNMADELAGKISEAGDGNAISVRVIPYEDADANGKIYDDLTVGALDIALIDDWALGRRIASLAMLGKPYVFANPYQSDRFYNGQGGTRINELTASLGFRIQGWIKCPQPVIVAKRPLVGPNDFSGLRLAAEPNPGLAPALTALGAIYVPLPAGERLSALQSGVVDAVQLEPVDLLATDVSDIAQEINAPGISLPYIAICCSNKVMTQLGGTLKEVFEEALQAGITVVGDNAFSANANALAKLAEMGYVVTAVNTMEIQAKMTETAPATTTASGGDQGLVQAVEEATAPTLTL